jgi:hypothetical protein
MASNSTNGTVLVYSIRRESHALLDLGLGLQPVLIPLP